MTKTEAVDLIRKEKESAFKWRERRQTTWNEIYNFYRGIVIPNRLTQRQSVHVPLMKSSVQTLLKDIDNAPMLTFKNIDNNDQAEVFYNEYWRFREKENKLVLKDIQDKKQVLLFGRSYKKLNIIDGQFCFDVRDPMFMSVDRFINPASIDTANFVCEDSIFVTLNSLIRNDKYDKQAVEALKLYMSSDSGIVKAEENQRNRVDKDARLINLGVMDVNNPMLGETVVELNDIFHMEWNEQNKDMEYKYYVIAENTHIIYEEWLEKCLGETEGNYWRTHLPYTTWASDIERTDWYSDGVGDILRNPNQILNAWFSQLVENRTLKNFGMTFYDSSQEGFIPQTFDPVAWGFYPVPGNPNEKLMRVDVPDLSDSMDDIQYLMTMAQNASAATAVSQGQVEKSQITLGEVQIAVANAKERVRSMAALYTDSWEEFGTKYVKLLEGSGEMIDEVKIVKKGRNSSKLYSRFISFKDWKTESGYTVQVKDLSGGDQSIDDLQKLNAAKSTMPDNKVLDDLYKKKLLEYANLNASEIKDVMDFESKAVMQPQQGATMNQAPITPTLPTPPQSPQTPLM